MEQVDDLSKPLTIPEILRDTPWLELALKQRALALVIAGESWGKNILVKMGYDGEDAGNLAWLQKQREAHDFEEMARKAKTDMISATTDYLRSRVLAYTMAEEEIALRGSEERNRLAALKDLSDRAGTGAAMKLSVSGTPSAYREMMKDMLADPLEQPGDTQKTGAE